MVSGRSTGLKIRSKPVFLNNKQRCMARIFTLIMGLLVLNIAKAQMPFAGGFQNNLQPGSFMNYQYRSDSSQLQKKWHLNKYAGISSMFTFFNGQNASITSVPVGLQLNRRLNNNLYAFAGASIAPAYFNMNAMFPATNLNKNYNGFNGGRNRFGVYSRAEAGLMYINDERTFSISGSIGVSNYNYPSFGQSSIHTIRQQPAAMPRQ